jgi:hypothetical protein
VTVAKCDEQVMEEFAEAMNIAAENSKSGCRPKNLGRLARRTMVASRGGHESGRRIVEILEKDREDIPRTTSPIGETLWGTSTATRLRGLRVT